MKNITKIFLDISQCVAKEEEEEELDKLKQFT